MMKLLCPLAFALTPCAAQISLDPLWSVTPDDGRAYITDSSEAFQRGLSYSPVSGNVLVANRAGGPGVRVLSGTSGADLHGLDLTGVAGGSTNFDINLVGCGADGAVYLANLVVSDLALPSFTIYRWADDAPTTLSTIAWRGDPAGEDAEGNSLFPDRWGDSLAVRGAGSDTQIAIAARRSGAVTIFSTTDGTNFTPTFFPSGGIPNGHTSVAFGPGDTLFLKTSQAPLRRVSFDLATRQLSLVSTFDGLPDTARQLGSDPARPRLAALDTSAANPERVQLYDVGDTASDPVFLAEAPIGLENTNTFATGAIAVTETTLYVLDTNNGVFAYTVVDDGTTVPPVIARAPDDRTTLSGSSVTFTATLGGTPPFALQWALDGVPVPGATSNRLSLTALAPGDSGTYTITATNAVGSASAGAELVVNPRLENGIATPLWSLPPGSRSYLEPDDTQRGLAYNPATGNLLLASRPGNRNQIRVLSSDDGSEVGQLRTIDIFQGFIELTKLQVATDGTIYACNQSLAGGDFKIYRYPSEDSAGDPDVIVQGSGTSFGQIGDTMAVRGTGAETEILCTATAAPEAVIYKPDADGFFEPHPIAIDTAEPNFGTAAEWGEGETFWAKSENGLLHQIRYDLENGTGTVERVVPAQQFSRATGPFAIAPGLDCIAGVAITTPDFVSIHRFSNFALQEQEFLPADNNNTEAAGAVAFGGGRLFVLDTNNGLAAFTLLKGAPEITSLDVLGTAVFFDVNGEPGARYLLEESTDLRTWTPNESFVLGAPSRTFSFPLSGGPRYFRAGRQN